MKIIMLSGAPNSGKTTTLNLVYDHLTKIAGANIIRPKTRLGGDPKDFECELDYKGRNIVFYTMGDFRHLLRQQIVNYAAKAVDILIVANSGFPSVVMDAHKYPGSVILVKTVSTSNMTGANQADMQAIIAII